MSDTAGQVVAFLVVRIVMRITPYAACAVLSRRAPVRARVVAIGAAVVAGLVSIAQGAAEVLVWMAAGYFYYTGLATCLNPLGRALRRQRVTPGALFVLLAAMFLVIPAVLAPGVSGVAFLIVGWELMLCGYSYCVESSRANSGAIATLEYRALVFFLLVNPTLVYSRCGTQQVGKPALQDGCGRAAFGAAMLVLNALFLHPLVSRGWAPSALGAVAHGALALISTYVAHSALAHLQIGLTREFGWKVPERYVFPFLAASPSDFWRRWNTYFRVWLEAYWLLPISTRLVRHGWRQIAPAVAVAVVLVVSGLLHDAHSFFATFRPSLRGTGFFAAAGVCFALWLVGGRAGAWLGRVKLPAALAPVRRLKAPISRLALAVVAVALATHWRG